MLLLTGVKLQETPFVHYINDPLYGIVGVTQQELAVIQTSIFQRLKNIKQLGTVNFVYPGANHSRFEHSIGTMHVTSLILDRIGCDEESKQIIRLAALLHDIGHGPFSHTFEELLCRNPDYVPVLNGKRLLDHEDFSRFILENNQQLREVLGSKVDKIIDFLLNKKAIGMIPSEIITGDIGSDRIDYLIRDTYYTGLGHRPDINSLISSMRISIKEKDSPRLTLQEEGILAAELLITTRYYHFSMIVHNPKTRSVELLFLQFVEKLFKRKSDPRTYMLKAFTEYDDSIILSELFASQGTLRDLFYSGKSFIPVYNIELRQIRSGLTKYCIYRFFYDKQGLLSYMQEANQRLMEKTNLGDSLVDVHLFEHYVPDIIYHCDKYETEKEWISPFIMDRSNILRLIPAEQLLRSSVCILSATDPGVEAKGFRDKIDNNRSLFLSRDFLVPLSRKSLTDNGFRLIDDFYTFICALRDFYYEMPWKSGVREEEVFRGISRFYDLIRICHKKKQRPAIDFQDFFKEENKPPFQYSIKGFSILNALSALGILRLEYIPDETTPINPKPFHFVYIIKPVEKDIRKRLYEGLPEFESLREEFLKIFRELDWDSYFAKFFPLKTNI